jgi:3-oxoacyl-[acyl-carrier-protein] synthase II
MIKRVVVTGISAVTSLGKNYQETWNNVLTGKSGVKQIPSTLFDASDLQTKVAAFIPAVADGGIDLDEYISNKDQKKTDRFIHLAIAAADQAISDSGWIADSEEKACRSGVIIGSGIGGLSTIYDNSLILQEKGPRRISPFFIPASLINLAPGMVSIKHGFKGPNHSVVTACATGSHAIGDAARMIMCGEADVIVAGGAESAVSRLGIAGFNACRALSTAFNDDPEAASRPWDRQRDGFVMGEGAAVLVLEDYEHAKSRGAKIYAELLGYGYTGDAYHITSPAEDGDGGFRAMKIALQKSGVSPEQIGYINAHSTATQRGDMIEIAAIKRLFQDDVASVSISSTKSSIGHLLGAAGSVEAVFSILAMVHGIIPPTLNLHDPDDGCEGLDLVPLKAKERAVDFVLSNSFGFGGTNVSLVFKKHQV